MLVFMPALNLAINTWNLKGRNPVLQASPNPDGMLVFMPALYLAITSWNLMARNPVLQASPNPDGSTCLSTASNTGLLARLPLGPSNINILLLLLPRLLLPVLLLLALFIPARSPLPVATRDIRFIVLSPNL